MYDISELVDAYLAGERAGYQAGARDATDVASVVLEFARDEPAEAAPDQPEPCPEPGCGCNMYDPYPDNVPDPLPLTDVEQLRAFVSNLEERVTDVEETTDLISTHYLGFTP